MSSIYIVLDSLAFGILVGSAVIVATGAPAHFAPAMILVGIAYLTTRRR